MLKEIAVMFLIIFSVPVNAPYLISSISFHGNVACMENERVINIALYESDISTNPLTKFCFRYGWYVNGRQYKFNITEIGKREVMGEALNNENFDVFIVGASAKSYLLDSFNDIWRENVRNFVANGGGYIGICGGANLASMGYENPKSAFQRYINRGVLGMANIYINDDFDGEWQYLLKVGFLNNSGQICIRVRVADENEIFRGFEKNVFNISYGGGPSFYLAGGNEKIKPLLIYDEELMHTKPIHYWIPSLHGWKIWKNVTTDIEGQWAAVETSYGEGKIFLFGPHPEEPFMENGSIVEYFGKSVWGTWQYLYSWVGGNWVQYSHNWWILRRCAAMASGVEAGDMPPISKLGVIIIKPIGEWTNGVYINNESLDSPFLAKLAEAIGKDIIIGNLTVIAYVTQAEKAEFYIDGELKYTSNETKEYQAYGFEYEVFTWQLDCSKGFHKLKVIVYGKEGDVAWDEREILVL